jgi:tetratricopeptide (TPR) repeat protein
MPALKGLLFVFAAGCLWLAAPAGLRAGNPDFDLALQQYQNNDWQGAVSNFSKSITASNDLYDCYSFRAYARAQLNDSNGAIADCNGMIKLDDTSGYYWRARIEEMLTNIDGAIADYNTGLKLNPAGKPDNLVSNLCADLTTRSYARCQAGDLAGALADVNLSMSLSSTNRQWARYFRGYVEMRQGDYAPALADENWVLANWPDDLYARSARAWARFGLKDNPGAAADSQQVIDVSTRVQAVVNDSMRNPILIEMQGLQCLIKGDYAGAQDDWNHFLTSTNAASSAEKAFYQGWLDRANTNSPAK